MHGHTAWHFQEEAQDVLHLDSPPQCQAEVGLVVVMVEGMVVCVCGEGMICYCCPLCPEKDLIWLFVCGGYTAGHLQLHQTKQPATYPPASAAFTQHLTTLISGVGANWSLYSSECVSTILFRRV